MQEWIRNGVDCSEKDPDAGRELGGKGGWQGVAGQERARGMGKAKVWDVLGVLGVCWTWCVRPVVEWRVVVLLGFRATQRTVQSRTSRSLGARRHMARMQARSDSLDSLDGSGEKHLNYLHARWRGAWQRLLVTIPASTWRLHWAPGRRV